MFKRILFVFLSSILITNTSAQSLPESTNPYLDALPSWASVLEKFVDDQGRVDFVSLSNDRAELDRFVDVIALVSPASNPELFDSREKVLAYHINAYNVLASALIYAP